jgi:hypothetical protein
MSFTAEGFNLDIFKSGGLHEKHAVANRDFGTISTFASRQREATETCVAMADPKIIQMHAVF